MRSERKTAVPLRMPRRKASLSPAAERISAARAATRCAIASASNAVTGGVIVGRILELHLVQSFRGAAHLETLRDLDTGNPDDLPLPHQQRESIADLGADFTINQKILQ